MKKVRQLAINDIQKVDSSIEKQGIYLKQDVKRMSLT
jgi:uncharacterized protein YcgL (UPF0745 family)